MSIVRRLSRNWLHVYAGFFVLFLYLPVLLVPIFALNNSAVPAFPLSGMTSKWFAGLAQTSAIHGAALNSLTVALTTSVLSTILGICVARAITRYSFRGMQVMRGVIMAPLILPEIIIAVSLLVVILHLGINLSLLTIAAGHVLFCVPYSISVLVAGFEGFDRSLEEASADLGETAFGTFRRVTLPMMAPSIISSLLVAFTVSFDEFILAFFLGGIEPTLPVYMFAQLRFAAKLPTILALGTVILVLSVALLIIAETYRRRAERRVSIQGGASAD